MATSSQWHARATKLLEKFNEYGECVPPDPTNTPENIPESMAALLAVAAEWHIIKDHYNVFECNLFQEGKFLNKVEIIGDQDLVTEWKDDHDSPNCAEEGWECFGAVSEYDYLFVCVDQSSSYYGFTRHIVNNCWEDNSLVEGHFDLFFEKLEQYAEEWLKSRNKSKICQSKEDTDEPEDEDEYEEEEETLGFLDHFYGNTD